MPKTCPYPDNINPLSPNGFMLTVAKFPELSFFSQAVGLPNISLPDVSQSNPFAGIHHPGDKLEFEPLSVEFLVDEDMSNYNAIFDWLYALGFPESNEEYIEYMKEAKGDHEYTKAASDGTLSILGSNNMTVSSFSFIDLIPISLSSLRFSSTSTDVEYLVATVDFRYTYMRRNQ